MKKIPLLLLVVLLCACKKNNQEIAIDKNKTNASVNIDYKQEMRNFVIGISKYAKSTNPKFAVIPQNGIPLVTVDGESTSAPSTAYLNAIDGNGQEDLYYGYDNDDQATDSAVTNNLRGYLDISKANGKKILVTDYCSTPSNMTRSYQVNWANGYISFAADERDLNNIPTFPAKINNENANVITSLSQAKNFLYLILPEKFSSKADFIKAVTATNYDALIMDAYFEKVAFTSAEVNALKKKANGGKRIVISYMTIGEAENYRYYWQNSWKPGNPVWLDAENPKWKGNFKVKYWNKDWQNIIYGNDNSYLKKILNAGFDGVYLDIIDAFEYYEGKN
ncbi:endo alpha-1,4 polygalactosaminidase [Mucilaginibacter lappiensis]|uniref:Cysteinyl-tRNA synthetase n=1 Tax=Mucilaginibacter lappiensis TaxID=354630 RepID=A0A841JN45_9SPHI|nr:endo alpha-1,4 polygalactosaminidase [Mucilaginibacter lappiensis]MBB6129765.1 cysteinyl-tRNA synthetase [Mucilaginibacter lappiensis]